MTERDYRDYIKDIVDSINDIESFTEDMVYNTFHKDKKTINAVIRSIEIIGEASKNIPNSLKEQYPSIPWKKMIGMRNKLIHEYSGVDLEILWQVIENDIPALETSVQEIFDKLINNT